MQSSLRFSLEEDDEEGKALSPSLEKDGNGEGLRHRLQKREGRGQGSRLLSIHNRKAAGTATSSSLEEEVRRGQRARLSPPL